MPIYDYACTPCKLEWESYHEMDDRYNEVCVKCGKVARKLISAPNSRTFRARWFDNIASEPVYIESDAQLKRVCKENESYVLQDDRGKAVKYWKKREKDLRKSGTGIASEMRRLEAV